MAADFDRVIPQGRPVGTFQRVNDPVKDYPYYHYRVSYNGETFISSLLSEVWEWAEDRGIVLMRVEELPPNE